MTQYDPGSGPDPVQPGAQPPSGPPAPPVQPVGYGYPQPVYGYPVQRGTNGLAIASLICAFLCVPLGLIFGIVARNQIKTSGEGGDGLALAGIIVSSIFLVLTVLYFVLIAALLHSATYPTIR